MEEIAGFTGRDAELKACTEWVADGYSIVIRGRAGIGKSALLRALRERVANEKRLVLWVKTAPPKAMLTDLAHQLQAAGCLVVPASMIPPRHHRVVEHTGRVHWEWVKRSIGRANVQQLANLLLESFRGKRPLLFIESLEVPPTQADFFIDIAPRSQIIAAVADTNRRERVRRLLWDIERELELKPLPAPAISQITQEWLSARNVGFTSPRCEKSFMRYAQQESGGNPLALRGLLEHASKNQVIDCKDLRAYRHGAAVQYFDMTPVIVIAVVATMALRYVSRGLGEMEMMVMSGVASAMFYGLSILLRSMRR